MLKKTVTYEDPFTGDEVTEDLYFNITKAELVEMELMHEGEGGLKEHLERISRAGNGQVIMDEMKHIIMKSYGVRRNGKFIKTQEVREEFEASEAYSTLFMEMVTNADAAVEFVGGILPKGLEDSAQEAFDIETPNLKTVPAPVEKPEPKSLTHAEAAALTSEELRSGLAEGRYILQ